MAEKEHKRSVQDEQFDRENTDETTKDRLNEHVKTGTNEDSEGLSQDSSVQNVEEKQVNPEQKSDSSSDEKELDTSVPSQEHQKSDNKELKETETASDTKPKDGTSETRGQQVEETQEHLHEAVTKESKSEKDSENENPSEEKQKIDFTSSSDEGSEATEPVASSEDPATVDQEIKVAEESSTSDGLAETKTEPVEDEKKDNADKRDLQKSQTGEEPKQEEAKEEPVDYSSLNKEELIEELRKIIDEKPLQEVKDEVDQIRFHFIKKHKAEVDNLRKKFLEQGGQPQDFKPEEDPLEKQLKAYIEQFREKRTAYNKELEESKHANLEEKYRIIEEIKDLVNRKESLNKTFQEFRDLQARWREVGLVPQANVKDLWETYHHHVEKFYDYIKINKELRDLDLKKNLEAKISLCEKAEELLLEPNIINAFKTLQTYHDQWREIGPVPADMRTEIWERFKEATSKINKKHQEYYDNLKQEQKNNLESKKLLCEKAEEIADMEITSYKDWDQRSDEMKELQKVWKTIGFAPRKENNKIYDRFRSACDRFFNNKREFYAKNREEQSNNLQLKTDLCIQAEALKDSTEWKKTTEDLIELQKRWKQIGPVPKKYSDSIWKRFRSACDEFFNRKSEHFDNIDSKYEDNLKLKEDLIAEIESFTLSESVEENLMKLKEFQRRWAEIGFVPIKKKDEIQHRYRETINHKFDNLKIDETKKNIIKFKTKLDDLSGKPRSDYRLRQDREKFLNKLKQLENDIVLWENNIGFFAKSKNADEMISDVENKIKGAKEKMEVLQQKIDLIDSKLDDE